MRIFQRSALSLFCQIALRTSLILTLPVTIQAQDVVFNTAILDLKDRDNIDLSQFSRKGYIMPGDYSLAIKINDATLPEQSLAYYAPDDEPEGSQVCLTPEIVAQLGLKPSLNSELQWWHENECLQLSSLAGMEARTDLGSSTLYLSIPQAYLEYQHADWDPPSRWENGIPGLILDYNLNLQNQRQNNASGESGSYLTGNGTAGANVGAWRLRADWQARHDWRKNYQSHSKNVEWNRIYAFRALKEYQAKLTVGEDYLNSAIFDNFRFVGGSLVSDDQMLPPNLRGYAPEVAGVAQTNAKVVISQQGRVIQETQVAAGPFRIQDLSSAVSGLLDVRVEEQDGQVHEFQVDTASIPYLTRPGMVRFKTAVGQASDYDRRRSGSPFATGEFSWGVSNGWSFYGGVLGNDDYQAIAAGIGRDLLGFGAISADITQSSARFANQPMLRGRSYRLSYSKRFLDTGSNLTFAGYRFAESDFLNMNDFLDMQANRTWNRRGRSKEMYTATFNQQIESLGLHAYFNYSHQTYWDAPDSDYYNLTFSSAFSLGNWRNLSLSLTGYRSNTRSGQDEGAYLSLSIPWGQSGRVSYNGATSSSDTRHNLSYYDRLGDNSSYQVSAGSSDHGSEMSGYYTLDGALANVKASGSHHEGRYSALGLSLQGGMTLTPQGGALHRATQMGGTRVLVDTDGIADVPVGNGSRATRTNLFGKAVVSDLSNYYRTSVKIDVDKLNDNVEAIRSVAQTTLTEGAIGFRRFDVIAGEKAMAIIRLADGSFPPFGATVQNQKQQETGIVNDEGNVYLSGIQQGGTMSVRWNGDIQCHMTMPHKLPADMSEILFLPCERTAEPQS